MPAPNWLAQSLSLVVCLVAVRWPAEASPIVGGIPVGANNPFDFPFMVSLQMCNSSRLGVDEATANATKTAAGLNHFCGGVYLSRGYVITAAHCMANVNASEHEAYAVIGANDLRSASAPKSMRAYRIEEIISKRFDPYTYENDIAILRLDTSQLGEPVAPHQQILLPGRGEPDLPGASSHCYLIGYGSTRINGNPTLKLHIGPNQRITPDECQRKLGRYMAPEPGSSMFCAEGKTVAGQQVDACQGDSGGPYLCRRGVGRYEALGLTSYGAGCGVPNTPGVYTEVLGHLSWIDEILARGVNK